MKSNEKRGHRPARATITGVAVVCTICLAASFCVAASISTEHVLPNYAIVSVGPNASLMVNSGPIVGSVLIGGGSNATSAGGGNGSVTGRLDVSGTATGDNLQKLQTPATVSIMPASLATEAFSEAAQLSTEASGLTPTQTFGAITGTQTITGTAGINVINIASLHNPTLTLSGNADTIFVINVAGLFSTNRAITLQGITASQILWNLTGTGTVLQTSGGNTLYGTFLATNGGDFQFSSLNLTGALINTAGHIQFVSNSRMTIAPFIPPQTNPEIPEPSTLLMLGTGLLGGGGLLRRKAKARLEARHGPKEVFGGEPIQIPGSALSAANRTA